MGLLVSNGSFWLIASGISGSHRWNRIAMFDYLVFVRIVRIVDLKTVLLMEYLFVIGFDSRWRHDIHGELQLDNSLWYHIAEQTDGMVYLSAIAGTVVTEEQVFCSSRKDDVLVVLALDNAAAARLDITDDKWFLAHIAQPVNQIEIVVEHHRRIVADGVFDYNDGGLDGLLAGMTEQCKKHDEYGGNDSFHNLIPHCSTFPLNS